MVLQVMIIAKEVQYHHKTKEMRETLELVASNLHNRCFKLNKRKIVTTGRIIMTEDIKISSAIITTIVAIMIIVFGMTNVGMVMKVKKIFTVDTIKKKIQKIIRPLLTS